MQTELIQAAKQRNIVELLNLLSQVKSSPEPDAVSYAICELAKEHDYNAVLLLGTHAKSFLGALHGAAAVGDIQHIIKLLETGVDVNDFFSTERVTPLHVAALHGQIVVLKLLIRAGANVNAMSRLGYTPLGSAVEGAKIDVIHALIDHGAMLEGSYLFRPAITNNHPEIIPILANAGANPNEIVMSSSRTTALQLAAKNGKIKAIQALAASGANFFVNDKHGQNVFWYTSPPPGVAPTEIQLLTMKTLLEELNNTDDWGVSCAQFEAALNGIRFGFFQVFPKDLFKPIEIYNLLAKGALRNLKEYLKQHANVRVPFRINDETILHYLANEFARSPRDMTEIIDLLVNKHRFNPYRSGKHDLLPYELYSEKHGSLVPSVFFARESHYRLHQLLKGKMLEMLTNIICLQSVRPIQDMQVVKHETTARHKTHTLFLSPEEQITLIKYEIRSLLIGFTTSQTHLPYPLIRCLKNLLKQHPERDAEFSFIPLVLSADDHTNLEIILINLQRLSRLVLCENSQSELADDIRFDLNQVIVGDDFLANINKSVDENDESSQEESCVGLLRRKTM